MMGLFENLGRKAEQFKQDVTDTASEPTHTCTDCPDVFFTDYEECPDCSGEVVPLESTESE